MTGHSTPFILYALPASPSAHVVYPRSKFLRGCSLMNTAIRHVVKAD
ncbi:predicted protein [Plenodomus lingam JN3]|uniref:Predicted protein n=1 Tax=Leptosphaeria maculans (strain JN3 / isolate v23.1.3 / race Av1-4-5-6-7-8) TaxID=985895 RepID=E4ZNT8_LEPMJ|nr:predicted protein [Plenodomus lingam JN3]CBX93307.1 predicted protein [Plenodomus lingam JN3]